MSDRELMQNVKGSYADFVNSMTRWMNRDNNIRQAILKQLEIKPDSNTDDITLVLWGCLGIDIYPHLVDSEEHDLTSPFITASSM